MAFGSSIISKLGLDYSDYDRGMDHVASKSVDTGDKIGRTFERKFGAGDAFKSVLAAFTLSIEGISNKIAEAWVGGTKQGFEDLARLADENARLIDQKIKIHQTPAARESYLRREIDKAARDEANSDVQQTPAENFARQQQSQNRRLQLENELDETLKRKAESMEREVKASREALTLAQREAALADLPKFERSVRLSLDAAKMRKEAARIVGDETAKNKKLTEAIKAEAESKRLEADISREAAAAAEKEGREKEQALEKEAHARDRARKAVERYYEAVEKAEEVRKELQVFNRDRLAFGLDEAAAGRRGTPTDRVRADRILRKEAEARRLFDTGNEKGALARLAEADRLRSVLSGLDSKSKDPLEAQRKAITESEKHLAKIANQLLEPKTIK
jgi:hypothetical protein